MNTKNLFLTALLTISAMQSTLPAETDQKEPSPKGWEKFCKTYATSFISGGLIGSVTGLLSKEAIIKSAHGLNFDKPNGEAVVFGVIIPILILISEYKLRSNVIDDINQSFEENEIQHKKNLVRDTAWIASWITFLSSASNNKI
jgi:hypothetical protein